MTEKRIRVRIPGRGLAKGHAQVKVEAVGFQGQGCSTSAKRVADALGSIEHEELKEDYYLHEQSETTTQAENG